MVVLHELALEAGGLFEGFGIEAFEEEATVVAEDFGFEDDDFGDGGGGSDHLVSALTLFTVSYPAALHDFVTQRPLAATRIGTQSWPDSSSLGKSNIGILVS